MRKLPHLVVHIDIDIDIDNHAVPGQSFYRYLHPNDRHSPSLRDADHDSNHDHDYDSGYGRDVAQLDATRRLDF